MKTGIVFEGGAVRAMFSAGVSDALLTRGLLPDYVVGVSAGIAYGVSYVSRQSGRNWEIMRQYINDRRYMGFANLLRRDNRAFFGLDFVYDAIPNRLIPFDYAAFAAFPGTVEAVVTHLRTGEAAYYPLDPRDRRNHLLRVSCAMPLLFPVMEVEGEPAMDGGAADPIPFARALAQGCERIVVVLSRERGYVRGEERMEALLERVYRAYPAFCRTLRTRAERYNASRRRLLELEAQGRALVLAPASTQGFRRTERDLGKIRALWQDGYDQTMARLDAIEAFWQGA